MSTVSSSEARNEVVGLKLRIMRRERGETLRQVGDAIGVRFQHVSDWEAGKHGISLRHAVKLARHFGVNPNDFLPPEQ